MKKTNKYVVKKTLEEIETTEIILPETNSLSAIDGKIKEGSPNKSKQVANSVDQKRKPSRKRKSQKKGKHKKKFRKALLREIIIFLIIVLIIARGNPDIISTVVGEIMKM